MLMRVVRFFFGLSFVVMERCYDKYEVHCVVIANNINCPTTALTNETNTIPFPLILKPKHGSDSINIRLLKNSPIPTHTQTDDYITQQYIRNTELTVTVFRDQTGMPLHILLPKETPYSFFRKYLLQPHHAP